MGLPVKKINAIVCPNPFKHTRDITLIPAGITVADALRQLFTDIASINLHVYINGDLVLRSEYETVVLRDDDHVLINVLPMGDGGQGGGKSPFLQILSILAIVGSAYFGGWAGGAFGKWGSIFGTAIGGFGASYLVKRLTPIPELGIQKKEDPLYAITGQSNQINKGGPIPRVYGTIKMFPSLGAMPYTEIEGNDMYYRALYIPGYGELSFDESEFKIGGVPISEFDDVQIEYCTGSATDSTTPSLFSNTIYEDQLNDELHYESGGGWATHVTHTGADTDEISIDFVFPGGLYALDSYGDRTQLTVNLELRYRKLDQQYLLYDNESAAFTIGSTITGGTSGATAEVLSDVSWGVTGALLLTNIVGTFQNNEEITDAEDVPGTADVNGTIGSTYLTYAIETDGPFTVGNTITGATSGTTGTLRGLQDDGTTGKLVIASATGDYKSLEGITDGTANALTSAASDRGWFPNSEPDYENLCGDFDEWTAVGGATYSADIDGSGNPGYTLDGAGEYCYSPYIQVNYSSEFDFIADYYAAAGTPSRALEIEYYRGRGSVGRFRNEDDESLTEDSTAFASGAWAEDTFEGTAGNKVKYIRVKILYDGETIKVRLPRVITSKTLSYTSKSGRTVRHSLRWEVTSPGQYVVQTRRTTSESITGTDTVYWQTLRTIVHEDPFPMTGVAKIALRVKATDQIHGAIDQFSCLPTSVLPVYDGVGEEWTDTATSNPAWAFCDALKGNINPEPATDAELDLTAIETWADDCASVVNGVAREINAVVDTRVALIDLLRSIAAIGRADYHNNDGIHSVIEDKAKATIIQHITPRNSSNARGTKTFAVIPHCLKIPFINADADYREDVVYVYDDGYDADNATEFETLPLAWGITNADQVWKEGRYHLACMRLRPEMHYRDMDIEHFRAQRGDRVQITDDVLQWGLGFARVKSVAHDAGVSTITFDDELTLEVGQTYQLRIRSDVYPSGSYSLEPITVTETVTTTSIDITDPLNNVSTYVEADNLAMFGITTKESIPVLVHSITPKSDMSATIAFVEYNAAIYMADLDTIPAFSTNVTKNPDPNRYPPAPSIYQTRSDEAVLFRAPDGTLQSQIVIELNAICTDEIKPDYLQVKYRETDSGEEWAQVVQQDADLREACIRPVEDGKYYDIRLRYVTQYGRASDWTEKLGYLVVGKTSLPADIDNLYIRPDNILYWSYTPPNDFKGFKLRYNDGEDDSWETGTAAHDGYVLASTFYIGDQFSGGTMTWMVKAFDTSGNESANAVTLVKDLGDPSTANVIAQIDYEADAYPGKLTDCAVDVGTGDLFADEEASLFYHGDDTLFYDRGALFYGSTYKALEYEFCFLPEPDDAGAELWFDYTTVMMRDFMYRITAPTYTDDFTRAVVGGDWADTGGAWAIADNQCEGTGTTGADYLKWTNTVTLGNKTYIYVYVEEGVHAADTDYGIRICGRIIRWKAGVPDKWQMDKGAGLVDCTNQPALTNHWLVEILADETINFYAVQSDATAPLEEFYVDSTTVSGTTDDFEFFLGDIGVVVLYDNVKMWEPDADWIPWPGKIVTDDDELYEFRIRSLGGATRGKITELTSNLDLEDVVEYQDDIEIAAGSTRLTLVNTYRAIKHVSLTVQASGAETATSATALDKQATAGANNGPDIQCYNAAGATAGHVDVQIRGY